MSHGIYCVSHGIVYLHVGLVSHVKDSTVTRQGLLNWMCFQVMNQPHAMVMQRSEWHCWLGCDPGLDTVAKGIETEFHR